MAGSFYSNGPAKRVRKLVHFGLSAVLYGCLALGVLSTRAALQFDVFPGYDGIVPEATWIPIMCEIKNDGPAFNGVIELTAGNFGQGQLQKVEVELPTGTLKRVLIPVFSTTR